MTIRPDEPWGREVPRPDDLYVVADDRALAIELACAERRPVAVASGDVLRTLGNPALADRATLNELPIDLIEVRLDDSGESRHACAHVVARWPWWRGGWLRGPILLVMNCEFRGAWDVAPRGHPNDGRVESFQVEPTFGLRDRLVARRRIRTALHVPHPAIATRSIRMATWTFPTSMVVIADGHSIGPARTIAVTVVPDAGVLYA